VSGARRLRPILRLVAPILAVLGIVALDLVAAVRSWPIPVKGLLDEPAHLLTACVALSVYAPGRTRAWPWVLLGAVAIDLDHIPLYLWGGPVATGGGRPVTHSATTVAALLVIALVVPKVRTAASGLAAGVLLHFVRDIATGPGVPLLWPLHPDPARSPPCRTPRPTEVGGKLAAE
jgi:inner membrane protein